MKRMQKSWHTICTHKLAADIPFIPFHKKQSKRQDEEPWQVGKDQRMPRLLSFARKAAPSGIGSLSNQASPVLPLHCRFFTVGLHIDF